MDHLSGHTGVTLGTLTWFFLPQPRAVTTGVVRDPGTPATRGDALRVARLSDRNCDRGCLRPTAQSDGKLRDTETCFL